jgi:hypothetical protein
MRWWCKGEGWTECFGWVFEAKTLLAYFQLRVVCQGDGRVGRCGCREYWTLVDEETVYPQNFYKCLKFDCELPEGKGKWWTHLPLLKNNFGMERADGRVVKSNAAGGFTTKGELLVIYGVRRYDGFIMPSHEPQDTVTTEITTVHS